MGGVCGWNTWRDLRERQHLLFGLAELPEGVRGVLWPRHGRTVLLIDKHLPRRERSEVLGHELVHDERGGGCVLEDLPPTADVFYIREERRVDNEVARRMVQLDRLAEVVELHVANDLPVEAWRIAEDFDVSQAVAERALLLLKQAG